MGYLTQDQIDSYHKNGYLVIESYTSLQECQKLKDEMKVIIHGFDAKELTTIFTTEMSQVYMLMSRLGY